MSDALDLIGAIIEDASPAGVAAVLQAAVESDLDVLHYCAVELGIGPELIMRRAAHWAGFAMLDRIPSGVGAPIAPVRLEALADMRMFRVALADREVVFAAPDFFGIIRLRNRLLVAPDLRDRLCLVPQPALTQFMSDAASDALIEGARQNLARRWPFASAQLELTKPARYGFVAALLLLAGMVLVAPHMAQMALLPVTLFLLLAPAAIRLGAVFEPLRPARVSARPGDDDLPIYSVLIPLRNEAAMVPQLFAAMREIDYPAGKLDIKFVVEAQSEETVEAVRLHLGDPRFSLLTVPDAAPRTKPKALNYALPLCRGEFVVVYDAEDIPDPDQLWKAVARFRGEAALVCLQARLVIDNGRSHWLARQFAAEYAGLFSVLLPALARWRLPMPLGGTSNHFRLSSLRELGGWDAFNVTEDADLGMRLARRRLGVDVLDSDTHENAPTQFWPWLGQRTRWMKGWMQTYIVHNRDPGTLLNDMGLPAFLGFQALVLGMIIAPLLHCAFLLSLVLRLATGGELIHEALWAVFYGALLLIGYGAAIATNLLGLRRAGRTRLFPTVVTMPLFWLLISVATIRAAHELVAKPFYWFKSPHRPAVSAAFVAEPPKRKLWLRPRLRVT